MSIHHLERAARTCVDCDAPRHGRSPRCLSCALARLAVAKNRSARVRRQHYAALAERDTHCGICGGQLDVDAPVFEPGGAHRRAVINPCAATIDHIVPMSAGGSDELDNLQLVHFTCNARKGARVS